MTRIDIQLTPQAFEAKKPALIAEGFVINGACGILDKNGVVYEYVWRSPVVKLQITGRGIMGRDREAYATALARKWFSEVSSADVLAN